MDAYEMGRSDGYGWDLGGFDSRDEVRAWLGWAGHTISEAGDRFMADRWGVEPYGDGWYTAIARYNRGAVEGALEQWDEAEACLSPAGVWSLVYDPAQAITAEQEAANSAWYAEKREAEERAYLDAEGVL